MIFLNDCILTISHNERGEVFSKKHTIIHSGFLMSPSIVMNHAVSSIMSPVHGESGIACNLLLSFISVSATMD